MPCSLKTKMGGLEVFPPLGLSAAEEERIEHALCARAAALCEETGLYVPCAVLDVTARRLIPPSPGKAAGQIWQYLHVYGAMPLSQRQKGMHLLARLLSMGVGWLAREGKLTFVQDRRVMKLHLQDERQG